MNLKTSIISLFFLCILSLCKAQDYQVSNNVLSSFDADGIYKPFGMHDGVTYYKHETKTYFMFRDGDHWFLHSIIDPDFINALDFRLGVTPPPSPPTGNWDVGSVISLVTLPVELSYFKGRALTEGIHLEWQTASESGNHSFRIEKSMDAKTFIEIALIAGSQDSRQVQNYSYLDPNLFGNQLYYYRLKQVDLDGSSSYSNVIAISSNNSLINDIRVGPNPCLDELRVFGLNEAFHYQIFDLQGRCLDSGSNSQGVIPTHHLTAGAYVLCIIAKHHKQHFQFQK